MQGLVLLLVFFGTAMLVLGSYAFANRRRLAAAASLRQRVGENAPVVVQANILRDTRRSSVAAIDKLLESMSMTSALEYELRRAGAKWTVGEFLLGSAVTASLLLLLGQQGGTADGRLCRRGRHFCPVRGAAKHEEATPQALRGSASRSNRHDRQRDAGWVSRSRPH
jgi:hypothetical protein